VVAINGALPVPAHTATHVTASCRRRYNTRHSRSSSGDFGLPTILTGAWLSKWFFPAPRPIAHPDLSASHLTWIFLQGHCGRRGVKNRQHIAVVHENTEYGTLGRPRWLASVFKQKRTQHQPTTSRIRANSTDGAEPRCCSSRTSSPDVIIFVSLHGPRPFCTPRPLRSARLQAADGDRRQRPASLIRPFVQSVGKIVQGVFNRSSLGRRCAPAARPIWSTTCSRRKMGYDPRRHPRPRIMQGLHGAGRTRSTARSSTEPAKIQAAAEGDRPQAQPAHHWAFKGVKFDEKGQKRCSAAGLVIQLQKRRELRAGLAEGQSHRRAGAALQGVW